MFTFQDIRIDSGRYNLYGKLYLIDKNLPTILLLHGLGFHSFEYDELAPLLVEQGYNCLALDFRCCGKSEGERGYWTLKDYIEDTNSALDYIRAEINDQIGVFGNSLGATVGVHAAADDRAHKIKSLVASNCATRPIDFVMNSFRKFLLMMCSIVSKIIPLRVSVNYFLPYSKFLSNSKIIRSIKNDKLISDARKFSVSTYKELLSWDATKIAGKIDIPILVLSHNENDLFQTKDQSMLLYNFVKEPKELKLHDAGHVPNLENANLVNRILSDWFNKTLKSQI